MWFGYLVTVTGKTIALKINLNVNEKNYVNQNLSLIAFTKRMNASGARLTKGIFKESHFFTTSLDEELPSPYNEVDDVRTYTVLAKLYEDIGWHTKKKRFNPVHLIWWVGEHISSVKNKVVVMRNKDELPMIAQAIGFADEDTETLLELDNIYVVKITGEFYGNL